MIEIIPIDITSIKVVKTELASSIEKSSRHFEAFISDRSALAQLQDSLTALQEVGGILKMMSIPGSGEMISEMLDLLSNLIAKADAITDIELSALSHAFVGLPCYIEYVIDKAQALPPLVLPFINELRTVNKKAIIPESEFVNYDFDASTFNWPAEGESSAELVDLAKRQRQMYQIGLIGLIREENLELKLKLMHRAMQRIADAAGSTPNSLSLFRLAEATLESAASGVLSVTYTRKRVLSKLDKSIKELLSNGDITRDDELLKELIYLNHISLCNLPTSAKLTEQLSLTAPEIGDALLQKERELMQGPNADTIMTMVEALREELAQTKEVLEIAAQGVSQASDFNNVVGLFQRASDILLVVGLTGPGQILSGMLAKVKAWADGSEYTKEELLDVADGLIYVESVMGNLNRMDLNFETSEQDEETKRSLMAQSQLGEAQLLVLQESQAAIAIAKKDISSFIESDFDIEHVKQVNETLSSIRGGLSILNLSEANAVLNSCASFTNHIVENGVEKSKAESVLETLADALIALEYYLSEIELHDVAPPNVLAVAEQSLESLGFPVNK